MVKIDKLQLLKLSGGGEEGNWWLLDQVKSSSKASGVSVAERSKAKSYSNSMEIIRTKPKLTTNT
jgi:hypothetical protein